VRPTKYRAGGRGKKRTIAAQTSEKAPEWQENYGQQKKGREGKPKKATSWGESNPVNRDKKLDG